MENLNTKGAFNPNIRWNKQNSWDIDAWVRSIHEGNVVTLSQAITLLESQLPQDMEKAQELLLSLPPTDQSLRIGISGAPGVGKSTLIEQLGLHICDQGKKLAVLAIDPSSQLTGGSILGDKTRMEKLSRHPLSFIRPSPTKGVLGGISAYTREVSMLCELAGFEIILVETVGVGQSEFAIRDMVDLMVLLLSPGAGDDLQGIKKGILEVCDLLVVNKADGDHAGLAQKTFQDFRHIQGANNQQVLKTSALLGIGINDLWNKCIEIIKDWKSNNKLEERRKLQAKSWLSKTFHYRASKALWNLPMVQKRIYEEEKCIENAEKTPIQSAFSILSFIKEQIL